MPLAADRTSRTTPASFPAMRARSSSPPRSATSTSSSPCFHRGPRAARFRSGSRCTTPATWRMRSGSRPNPVPCSPPFPASRWSKSPTASSAAEAPASTTWCSRRVPSRSANARWTTCCPRGRTCWPARTPAARCRSRRSCASAGSACRPRTRSRSSTRRSAERHFRRDCDLRVDRAVDRAALRVDAVHALRRLPLLGRTLQRELHVDAPDHQRLAVQLHLSCGFRDELPGGCGDLTRLQRASVGAEQSTRRGGDDIVERGGVRLVRPFLRAVVFRNRSVGAELHRLLLLRKPRVPKRTLHPLETDLGPVRDFAHSNLLPATHVWHNRPHGRRRGGISGAGAHPDARERLYTGGLAGVIARPARRDRAGGVGREVVVPRRRRSARHAAGKAGGAVEGSALEQRQRAGATAIRVTRFSGKQSAASDQTPSTPSTQRRKRRLE